MKKISVNTIMAIAVVLSVLITVFYTRSVTILYGGTELLIAGLCYLWILKKWRSMDSYLLLIALALTGFSFLNGLMRTEIKSVVLLSISLVLPLAVSALPIDAQEDNKIFKWAFIVGLVICAVQQYWLVFGEINSNTVGFMTYMSISVGFVWYLCSKKKLLPLLMIVLGVIVSLGTGSRNVAIIMAFSLVLLLLPHRWYSKRSFFRTIYLIVLIYTIFAAAIMEWGFNNEFINNLLVDFTEQHSDKAWEMSRRIAFLHEIREKIGNLDFVSKLFGEGIMDHHGHNMFYQSIYVYGYLGTVALYIFYIRIFEMARKLIYFNNDKIALGCSIALLGCFMLNGADVFLIGVEACAVIPQVFMGIIMFRYREMMHPRTQLTEGEETHESA